MKTYWGSGCIVVRVLTLALGGDKWSASRPDCFTPKEGRSHRAVLNVVVKRKNSQPTPGIEL
jgi:hypothetical protein